MAACGTRPVRVPWAAGQTRTTTTRPREDPDMTTPTPAPQGTHHYLLTLQAPARNGYISQTFTGTYTPPEGGFTRQDFYQLLHGQIVRDYPEFAQNTVLLFDIQPNQL